MIEIEHLTKACGLSEFRYLTFPSPRFDDVPVSQLSEEAEPASDPGVTQPPPAARASGSAQVEPRIEPDRPMPSSVLGEVAAVLTPVAASARSTRPPRAARSAWRAATSPPPPR